VKKFIRLALLLLLSLGLSASACKSTSASLEHDPAVADDDELSLEGEGIFDIYFPGEGENLKVSAFPEIWAYVVAGRENTLRRGMPISDIGYFGAEVSSYGTLVEVPDRRKITNFNGRVHLVVACNGRALTHFVLSPGSAERKALIADLLAASRSFDGLQIDFENVPARDGAPFLSFLAELRAGLGHNKMFTIALAARTRRIADDVYDYEKIKPLVDRILIMAYDEHWSGSAPGSIASMRWCRNVAAHGLQVIGREKLIMGLPFYGRAWGNRTTSQAYVYSTIERIIRENDISRIQREEGIPTFSYDVTVSVRVYYEDEYSLSTRMDMYRSMGVNAIGFWRLGQETAGVWRLMRLGHE
jgi:spore germination protein YaaH